MYYLVFFLTKSVRKYGHKKNGGVADKQWISLTELPRSQIE